MHWEEFAIGIRYLPLQGQQRVRSAFELAEQLHRGQVRSSGEPYFSHCAMVATLLSALGADADSLCAALLHDAVEDTILTLAEVGERFGSDVKRLVDGVTKLREADLAPTLDKRIETLRKMFTLMQEDIRIMVIKLCDRLHNMQTIAALSTEKQRRIAQETIEVYVKIADRLCMQDLRDELEGLSLAIVEPDLHRALCRLRSEVETEQREMLRECQEAFEQHRPLLPHLTITTETQSWSRLRAQRETGGKATTGSPSLTAVFVMETEEECYRVLYVLHHHYQREIGSFQDFISSPQINGYRGLHTTIIAQSGSRVRCKIRTREMQAYARRGVAILCFRRGPIDDPPGKGTLAHERLAWARNLPRLSAESREKSEEFWESLQSDILGESISIHAPDGRLFLVPNGSTVLDAAFYCFGEDTLHLQTVSVNGREVPLHTPIAETASIEGAFTRRSTVDRQWLQWAKTSLARALIRQGLSQQPEEEKRTIGKELLQEVFTRERRGLLEEFDAAVLGARLAAAGLRTLPEAYVALAEGRRTPEEVVAAIFTSSTDDQRKHDWILSFTIDAADLTVIRSLVDVYEKYSINLATARFWRLPGTALGHWRMRVTLTAEEAQALTKEVLLAGGRDVKTVSERANTRLGLVIAFLVFIWGLDPVLAKVLLHEPYAVHPVDFTIIRFTVFFFLCMLYTLLKRSRSGVIYQRLPLYDALLWIAGAAFTLVALTTYLALPSLLPQEYITMVYASAILIPTLTPFPTSHLQRQAGFVPLLLTITALLLLKILRPTLSWSGFGLGLLMLLSFTVFTIALDEFKRRHSVAARILPLLLSLSCIAMVLSLFLLPFSTLTSLTLPHFLLLAAYGFVMTGFPYILYYEILTTEGTLLLGKYFSLGLLLTLVGQYLVFGTIHTFSLLSLALICLSAFLLHYRLTSPPTPTSPTRTLHGG